MRARITLLGILAALAGCHTPAGPAVAACWGACESYGWTTLAYEQREDSISCWCARPEDVPDHIRYRSFRPFRPISEMCEERAKGGR